MPVSAPSVLAAAVSGLEPQTAVSRCSLAEVTGSSPAAAAELL